MFSYDAPHLSLSARILLGMYIINATYNVVFILYATKIKKNSNACYPDGLFICVTFVVSRGIIPQLL